MVVWPFVVARASRVHEHAQTVAVAGVLSVGVGEEFRVRQAQSQGETLEQPDHQIVAPVLESLDFGDVLVPKLGDTVVAFGRGQRPRNTPKPHGHFVVLTSILETSHVPYGPFRDRVPLLDLLGQLEKLPGQDKHLFNVLRGDRMVLDQQKPPFPARPSDLVRDPSLGRRPTRRKVQIGNVDDWKLVVGGRHYASKDAVTLRASIKPVQSRL